MDTGIHRSEVFHFLRKLRAQATALRSEVAKTLLRANHEQYAELAGQVHDAGDEAVADLLVDVNLAEVSRDLWELRDIEAAQRRIARGDYGICVDCEEFIARARLEAYPTAKRCLGCQQRHDRQRTPIASL